ncbi:hypothetical protein JCM10212_005434 [Sporobolomyces blumeae]
MDPSNGSLDPLHQSSHALPVPATAASATGDEDAQQRIEREARNVLRGYPVAAGLTGVANVVSHLPPLAPAPPSFFPSSTSTSTSLQPAAFSSLPPEPLFDTYAQEIDVLLRDPGNRSASEERWSQVELARVAANADMREQYQAMHQGGPYRQAPLLNPPFPFATSLLPDPPASSSSLAHQFLEAARFPRAPNPTAFEHPHPNAPPNPRTIAENLEFLEAYVSEQLARYAPTPQPSSSADPISSSPTKPAEVPSLPSSAPQTPSLPYRHSQQLQVDGPPSSSPDPLMMGRVGPSVNRYPQPQNGANGQSRGTFAHSPFRPSLESARPFEAESSASPFAMPGISSSRMLVGQEDHATPGTERLEAGFDADAGVESAVKRFKLESGKTGTSMPSSGTGGRGKVIGSEKKIDRFADLLSDLFSGDDSHILDTSSAALGSSDPNPHLRSPSRATSANATSLFRTTAVSSTNSSPLLSAASLAKLLKYVQLIGTKNKAEEMLEEVEDAGLARLLKLLERSWDGVHEQEYWDVETCRARDDDGGVPGAKGKGKGKGMAKGKGKQRKTPVEDDDEDALEDEYARRGSTAQQGQRRSSRSSSRSRSRSPAVQMETEEDDTEIEPPPVEVVEHWTGAKITSTNRLIRNLSDALLATRIALSVLTLPGVSLPKHLFSSDHLVAIVSLLRHCLDAFVVPLVEAVPTSPLSEIFNPAMSDMRERVVEVIDSLASATDLVANLVKQEELSEDLVIACVYYALVPFFHEGSPPPSTAIKRKSSVADLKDKGVILQSVKGVRTSSLNLVRRVYARYPEQRNWIVEEVLSNLGRSDATGASAKKSKGAIRLRNGQSIQTVSALLLHLVQTCSTDLGQQARKIIASGPRSSSTIDVNEDVNMQIDLGAPGEQDAAALDVISRSLVEPAFDSVTSAARTIVGVLLQRSSKAGKTASGTADSEYRAVLDHLVADLLSTLHLPEWPGAEFLLAVFCRSLMSTLSDSKSTHEVNALKGIALDHLGSIAARLCRDLRDGTDEQMRSLREIVAGGNAAALEKLFAAQNAVNKHLRRTEAASTSTEGAAEFARMLFARELQQALPFAAGEAAQVDVVRARLQELALSLWDREDDEDVFGPTPEDAQPRIDAVALELSRSQPLSSMYQGILACIVQSAESAQVTFRTKALRDISLIVAQDPDLFHQDNVRNGIENRMHDHSPAVRDAAIELVGKYVVGRPDLAVQYLPKLLDRISDAGLSVRRRVVKLLKVLYGVIDDDKLRIEICRRLVYRVLDEDDGIKDLAIDAVEELWFAQPLNNFNNTQYSLSSVIMNVVGVHDGRAPPVEEALRLIMSKHAEKGTAAPLDRLRQVMEELVDSLVESDGEKDVIACVRTVSVLGSVDAGLLSTAKASMLLPFLKSATTPEEHAISDYLLKIFRSAVLAMPKTASKFGRDLQTALLPMLNRPSPQVQTMQEVIACFAAVVRSQTQDFDTMIKVFGVSMTRLVGEKNKLKDPAKRAGVNVRQLPLLCYLTSLLCEHGDFDQIRSEFPATSDHIGKISSGSIADFTFDTLVELYNLNLSLAIKSTVLTSLSFVWRAHPTLMLDPASTNIVDAVFESSNPTAHVQVLRILQDFLTTQEKNSAGLRVFPRGGKVKSEDQGVKMDELVGDVEGFADSGVASGIAQRYLNRVIEASVSTNTPLQRLGIELVGMIARSGFIHPLTLAPTLVALSACPDAQVAAKATSTLTILHQKHASLLVTRFLEPARASYSYGKAVAEDAAPCGYRGDPVDSTFGRWFSLIHKEKRQVQLDYLKQLSRAFEIEPGATCTEDDVAFVRFVAEAVSTLDYKRNEEPMLVISRLNAILAVSGLQVLHLLEEGLEGGGGLLALANLDEEGSISGSPVKRPTSLGQAGNAAPSVDLVRQSVICGLALLLRDHLKQLYSITDAKMTKYVVGKKSALGDKTATRRHDAAIALGQDGYARMPHAKLPTVSEEDRIAQRATYMALVRDDGTINSLEELDSGDDA